MQKDMGMDASVFAYAPQQQMHHSSSHASDCRQWWLVCVEKKPPGESLGRELGPKQWVGTKAMGWDQSKTDVIPISQCSRQRHVQTTIPSHWDLPYPKIDTSPISRYMHISGGEGVLRVWVMHRTGPPCVLPAPPVSRDCVEGYVWVVGPGCGDVGRV